MKTKYEPKTYDDDGIQRCRGDCPFITTVKDQRKLPKGCVGIKPGEVCVPVTRERMKKLGYIERMIASAPAREALVKEWSDCDGFPPRC